MPTLEFKGKHHIYAHHLTVPYRPLETDETRSCNPTGEDDNFIIHGDNLHALKALLPRYANRIKCIYIDPPYNKRNLPTILMRSGHCDGGIGWQHANAVSITCGDGNKDVFTLISLQ